MAAEALLDAPRPLVPSMRQWGVGRRFGALVETLRGRRPDVSTAAIDVSDVAGEYVIRIALPADVDGVEIPIGGKVLRLAPRGTPPARLLRLGERPYGWFLRTVALPPGLPLAALRARLRNDTLEIRVPA